jgi:ribosomal protein L29
LRLRTTLYETIALLRLALRSQQDLDETRLELTTALLEERMSTAADQLVSRRRT